MIKLIFLIPSAMYIIVTIFMQKEWDHHENTGRDCVI